jgi:hypothetical protein
MNPVEDETQQQRAEKFFFPLVLGSGSPALISRHFASSSPTWFMRYVRLLTMLSMFEMQIPDLLRGSLWAKQLGKSHY